jgi:hypothetical protein
VSGLRSTRQPNNQFPHADARSSSGSRILHDRADLGFIGVGSVERLLLLHRSMPMYAHDDVPYFVSTAELGELLPAPSNRTRLGSAIRQDLFRVSVLRHGFLQKLDSILCCWVAIDSGACCEVAVIVEAAGHPFILVCLAAFDSTLDILITDASGWMPHLKLFWTRTTSTLALRSLSLPLLM